MAKSKIPWLDTESNGVYYVFWYDAKKRKVRRLSLGTREAAAAQARYAAFLTEHARVGAELDRLLEPKLTIATALDDYHREHICKKSSERDQYIVGLLVKKLKLALGSKAVADLTPEEVDAYQAARMAGEFGRGPAASSTIRRELSVLIAAISHEIRRKRLAAGDRPEVPLPEPAPPRERWLTGEELDRLFAAALADQPDVWRGRLPRIYRFCTTAYYTASRKTAVVELKRFQIDLNARLIYLNPPGRRQTSKRRVVAPIFNEHLPIVLRAEQEAISEWHLDGPANVDKDFWRVRDAAGLGADVTPHTLRHTRATHLLQSGTDPWAVAGLLGDKLETVMRVYGHHCPGHIRAAVEAAMRQRDMGENSGETPKTA